MEMNFVVKGFVDALGIKELMLWSEPGTNMETYTDSDGWMGVTIRTWLHAEIRIVKDVFSDSLLVANTLSIHKYQFNRYDVERRYKAAVHRMNDAAGKKREDEMKDREYGARIALILIKQTDKFWER